MSKVLIITSSLRANSNSDALAEKVAEGARNVGHKVEVISLKGKEIKFCIGCLSCQKTKKCVLNDDVNEIREKVRLADTLVFATPIYYYEMSGQLKTFLDRMNPLYVSDYNFKSVYMVSTATENEESTPEKAVNGLQGWVDCFDGVELSGSLFIGGNTNPNDARKKENQLTSAYDFGKNLK